MKPRSLVGSGDKLGRLTLPFLVTGVTLNILIPPLFSVGGPPAVLTVISVIILVPGVTIWLWSVALIITRAAKGELIRTGPYALIKHPIYASVALLVLPWVGFLFNTWVGALVGTVLYIGSRIYAPEEEELLSKTFGPAWEEYRKTVKIPWL